MHDICFVRNEYVERYVDFTLNQSVMTEYNAFADGFLRVCGGKVLTFFHPQELMELIVGCSDYDFSEIEKVSKNHVKH